MLRDDQQEKKQPGAEDAAAFFSAVIAERETGDHSVPQNTQAKNEQWLNENFEGQLAVDVYQTRDAIVIESTLAGVRVEDIDIAVNNDMVTIKGIRRRDHSASSQDYFYQECYWGGFSRSIILPVDVRAEKVSATLKNGILTVVLPKADKPRTKTVKVTEEFDEEPGQEQPASK